MRWLKNKTRIDSATERELQRARWDQRDRALFHEIMYGVVRQHGRIEWLINRMTTTRDKPDPAGHAAVAVGLYQILFLDRIPEYAIVDSAVEIAKRHGGPLVGGWVNAILRRATVDKAELLAMLPDKGVTNSVDRLSVEHSYPSWMVSRWSDLIGKDGLREFLEWGNRRSHVTLRVNTQKIDSAGLFARLEQDGAKPSLHDDFPNFISIEQSGEWNFMGILKDGLASVQDLSQGLVARLVDPKPEEEILDLCSAPGGKTGHLSEIQPEAIIYSTDKAEERLQLVGELVERNGYTNVKVAPYHEIVGSRKKFDAVLVDAPCSGTGVLSKRPDLRWRRSPDDIKRMSSIQASLLNYAADRVKTGGRVIYSTCSVEPEENGQIIDRFLANRGDFEQIPVNSVIPDIPSTTIDRLQLWGTEIKADGVFAAILRKN